MDKELTSREKAVLLWELYKESSGKSVYKNPSYDYNDYGAFIVEHYEPIIQELKRESALKSKCMTTDAQTISSAGKEIKRLKGLLRSELKSYHLNQQIEYHTGDDWEKFRANYCKENNIEL